ncbi:MAG: SMC-Scp complex subunit ScpB [Phycisphaerales bacterium]
MSDTEETQIVTPPAETDATEAPAFVAPNDPAELALCVEAILMTVDRPIPAAKIAEAMNLDSAKPVTAAIAALNEQYDKTSRSFRIEQLAGGFQILTLARFKGVLATMHKTSAGNKLSAAAMETLAIIAYKQPVLRTSIETIRGVACGEMVRQLMERNLVKIVGRAEEIGRPMLYGTTKHFLELFGLSSLKDLPKAEELAKP